MAEVIVGTGVDIVSVSRLKAALERQGDAMKRRLFTQAEILAVDKDARRWERFASRFAAKEAVMKSLGLGIWQVSFGEIEVVSDGESRPIVNLSGRALVQAQEAGVTKIHISMSHEKEHAIAYAIAVGEVV